MKRLAALILALLMLFSFAACGQNADDGDASDNTSTSPDTSDNVDPDDETPSTEPLTIAYSCISYSLAPLTTVLADNLREAVEAEGWTFNMLTAEGDTELQGEQVSQLVSMQPDYLLLFAGDSTLAVDWLEEAAANDVPVILLQVPVTGGEDNSLCFVGTDNEQVVESVYEYMIEQNPDTELNIVQIAGVPTQVDYIIRTSTFAELAASNDNLNLLGDIAWAYSSRADAQTAMENFLTTYGDQIDVVMGYADNLTLGACAALDEAGRDDVQVYSIAYSINSYDAVAKGQMVTVHISTASVAEKTVDCILANEAGETLDYEQYIDCPVIDASNMDQYEAEY